MRTTTRRAGTSLLLLVLAGLTGLPSAVAGESAPVPEDYEPPLSSVSVYTAWETPLSSVGLFYTEPEEVDAEALEEALGARQESGATVIDLSDRFLFDFDSAELRPTAAARLDTLVPLLQEVDDEVEVIGHTDSLGGDAVNQPLSEERAEAVAGYLTDAGIDAERITTSGAGSSEPVADNTHPDGRDNPEGRQQNRRVEIRYAGG